MNTEASVGGVNAAHALAKDGPVAVPAPPTVSPSGRRPSGPCGKCGHPGPPDPSGYAFQGIQAKVERQRSVINQMVGKGIPEVVRDLDTRSDLRFGGPRIAWEGREWVTASQFQALMDDRNRLAKWVTELLGAKMDGESRLYGKGTPPLQNDPQVQS